MYSDIVIAKSTMQLLHIIKSVAIRESTQQHRPQHTQSIAYWLCTSCVTIASNLRLVATRCLYPHCSL